jgi:hypothetical protein
MTILKDLKAKNLRATQVKAQLDYPVIDTIFIPATILNS